jgi:hypothetical protein
MFYKSLFHVCSPCLSYHYMFSLKSCLVSGYVSISFEVCIMSIWVIFMSHEEYVLVYWLDYRVSWEERTLGIKGGYDS